MWDCAVAATTVGSRVSTYIEAVCLGGLAGRGSSTGGVGLAGRAGGSSIGFGGTPGGVLVGVIDDSRSSPPAVVARPANAERVSRVRRRFSGSA